MPKMTSDLTDADYKAAVVFARSEGVVRCSALQNRFALGYNAAAFLIERMEREGVVSTPDAKGRRQVVPLGAAKP